jgi:hypothetical protein
MSSIKILRGVIKTSIHASRLSSSSAIHASRPFPSLTISRKGLTANGTFAESQLAFLSPDKTNVAALDTALKRYSMSWIKLKCVACNPNKC